MCRIFNHQFYSHTSICSHTSILLPYLLPYLRVGLVDPPHITALAFLPQSPAGSGPDRRQDNPAAPPKEVSAPTAPPPLKVIWGVNDGNQPGQLQGPILLTKERMTYSLIILSLSTPSLPARSSRCWQAQRNISCGSTTSRWANGLRWSCRVGRPRSQPWSRSRQVWG